MLRQKSFGKHFLVHERHYVAIAMSTANVNECRLQKSNRRMCTDATIFRPRRAKSAIGRDAEVARRKQKEVRQFNGAYGIFTLLK